MHVLRTVLVLLSCGVFAASLASLVAQSTTSAQAATGCEPVVDHVEYTQSLQRDDNSMPLIDRRACGVAVLPEGGVWVPK